MWIKGTPKIVDVYLLPLDGALGTLRKIHSNLYRYYATGHEDQPIEFITNTGTPSLGGFVLQVPGEVAEYITKTEAERKYNLERV